MRRGLIRRILVEVLSEKRGGPHPRHFEDLPPEEQGAIRARYLKELDALYEMDFPFEADFDGEPVMVLGPIDRFEPYKSHPARSLPHKTAELLCRHRDGRKFIAFAQSLRTGGRSLVTRTPPRRPTPFPWAQKT